jgi:molybdate transport system substrate-binding protein
MKYSTVSLVWALFAMVAQAAAEMTVFAAASMSDAMKALAAAYVDQGGEPVRFNFASSGALARQIDAGAPADVYVSANQKWMDWLAGKELIDTATRFDLAGNRLVMIAPRDAAVSFDGQITGRLAVGDFNGVPAGMYAREALEYMGWLEALRPKLVTGSNVRTVLMYVERGEVDAGIVYASDAQASDKVETVGTFPPESHAPIVYIAAACSHDAEARRFIEFLKTDQAKTVIKTYGFIGPTDPSN